MGILLDTDPPRVSSSLRATRLYVVRTSIPPSASPVPPLKRRDDDFPLDVDDQPQLVARLVVIQDHGPKPVAVLMKLDALTDFCVSYP